MQPNGCVLLRSGGWRPSHTRRRATREGGLGSRGWQFVGFLLEFTWPERGLAIVIGIAAGASAFLVALIVARRAMPLKLSRPAEENAILDERHAAGVGTLADVSVMRRLYASHMLGHQQLRRRQVVIRPRIAQGRWVFPCPDCGPNHINMATPGLPTVVCVSCSGEFPARFPQEREEIERLLLARRDPDQRNWSDQTVAELRAENTTG